uniref:Uncharacterized protein n=1 Tax=Tetranychus urticae TaxID=32264 RepID=T1K9C1_TETUR
MPPKKAIQGSGFIPPIGQVSIGNQSGKVVVIRETNVTTTTKEKIVAYPKK